jgi:hypothetical protein
MAEASQGSQSPSFAVSVSRYLIHKKVLAI